MVMDVWDVRRGVGVSCRCYGFVIGMGMRVGTGYDRYDIWDFAFDLWSSRYDTAECSLQYKLVTFISRVGIVTFTESALS
jgi:hypothetical protein